MHAPHLSAYRSRSGDTRSGPPRFARLECAAFLVAVTVFAAMTAAAPAGAATTILDADFDDKTVDELIGFGGAAAGEPVDYGTTIDQSVRGLPFPTNCLEIADYTGTTETIRFEFLNDFAAVDGRITFRFWVRFDEISNYAIRIRERETSSVDYLNLVFSETGSFSFSDEAGFGGLLGMYEADEFYEVGILFDLANGNYTVGFDGEVVLLERPFSLPGGIGAILFATPSDLDGHGNMYVDELVVEATGVPTPVEPTSWGSLKARWR